MRLAQDNNVVHTFNCAVTNAEHGAALTFVNSHRVYFIRRRR
jgi:hypothetical protein